MRYAFAFWWRAAEEGPFSSRPLFLCTKGRGLSRSQPFLSEAHVNEHLEPAHFFVQAEGSAASCTVFIKSAERDRGCWEKGCGAGV